MNDWWCYISLYCVASYVHGQTLETSTIIDFVIVQHAAYPVNHQVYLYSYIERQCRREGDDESEGQMEPQTLGQHPSHHGLRQRHDGSLGGEKRHK